MEKTNLGTITRSNAKNTVCVSNVDYFKVECFPTHFVITDRMGEEAPEEMAAANSPWKWEFEYDEETSIDELENMQYEDKYMVYGIVRGYLGTK